METISIRRICQGVLGGSLIIGLGAAIPLQSSLSKAAFVPAPLSEKTIDLQFNAGFLEAGRQKANQRWGDEIHFDEIEWSSPTEGSVLARVWNVSSLIQFHISEDRKALKTLRFNPKPGSPGNMWEAWRHRHAYIFLSGDDYRWNSLEDEKPRLDYDTGAFYDEYLKELWSFWTVKRLPNHASGKSSSVIEDESDVSAMKKSIRVRLDQAGLVQPLPVTFQINLWHMPVKIFFEVDSSSNAARGYPEIHLVGKYTWTYNRAEWRRRHGYQQDFWGDYKVDADWPEQRRLSQTDGGRLDELLDRTVAYWVDVSIQQVLADLQQKVQMALVQARSEVQ
ncbi:MAG: hypothetical protein KCHDKBKB_02542 [Elusimicrobia bacterium]|nr:hypothetical protein [Elusimicrobiota bacterium]